jgi:hypothetical protein
MKGVSKLAGYLGFTKTYNFFFYFLFAGALLGFALARFQFLNFNGIFCGGGSSGASPGECYYYTRDHYKVGMMLHLFCILPASLLAIFQYVVGIMSFKGSTHLTGTDLSPSFDARPYCSIVSMAT